jgi:hypothetical protein
MSKKSHSQRQRAVWLVELEHMTDDELSSIVSAIPTTDPRFGAVALEWKKRSPRMKQALIERAVESAPDSLSKEDAKAMMEDMMNPELFNRFLDETGNRERFNQIAAGNEEELDEVVHGINDQHASVN